MGKLKIVADDKIPYLKGALDEIARVEYMPGAAIAKQDLLDADALIIRTRTKCNAALLEGTGVKFIATATIGYDHIDTAYCAQAGINWTNAPGCNSGSVMQYMASALTSLAEEFNVELSGKTLGVVGVGNVGGKVANLATNLGMRVLLNDPPRAQNEPDFGFTSLDVLIKEADILTFHVPLVLNGNHKTQHMVNSALLSRTKPGVFIINTSRGEVVSSTDLLNALKNETIAGAVLDVWENEPDINPELLKKVIFGTPHIAGYSRDGKANGTTMSVQALSAFFNLGKDNWQPQNVEQPEKPIIIVPTHLNGMGEVMKYCIHHVYQIAADDARLRANTSAFEKLRGEYPVRREFGSYTIQGAHLSREIKQRLLNIGFKSE